MTRERSDISLRRTLLETVNGVEQAYWTLVAAQRNVRSSSTTSPSPNNSRAMCPSIEAKTAPESGHRSAHR